LIEAKIEKIFTKVFSTDTPRAINKAEYEEWDSLKHIELILEFEDEFNLEIDDISALKIIDFNSSLEIITGLSL
jgi:acyl carrier protein